jgi:protein-disulfide isomerase
MALQKDTRALGAKDVALIVLLSAFLGFAGGWAFQATGIGRGVDEAAFEEYLMTHPEVIPAAIDELQRRERADAVGPLRPQLEQPFPGAVIGNPQGSVTLVEFSDYGCSACMAAQPHVKQLIADNPDLRVVVRELPIISEHGVDAARMALAAARQGKYAAFHDRMYAARGPDPANIEQAARDAGVDLERARADIESGAFDAELQANLSLAQQLGFSGTPSWTVGDNAFNGVVGVENLQQGIDAARDPA